MLIELHLHGNRTHDIHSKSPDRASHPVVRSFARACRPLCGHIAKAQIAAGSGHRKDAGAHGWQRESLGALRSHQPTPRSIAEAEGGRGAVFEDALDSLDRARTAEQDGDTAHAAGTRACACHSEIAKASRSQRRPTALSSARQLSDAAERRRLPAYDALECPLSSCMPDSATCVLGIPPPFRTSLVLDSIQPEHLSCESSTHRTTSAREDPARAGSP